MNWDRQGLREWVKTIRGLRPADTDGLLTDTMIHDAIDDAIRFMAQDCNLTKTLQKIRRIADQWEYPLAVNEILSFRGAYYLNDSGTWIPLGFRDQESFIRYRNPETDLGDPGYFCYPIRQRQLVNFFAQGPLTYDYIQESRVTLSHIRTLEDSGANFGRTLLGVRVIPGMVVRNLKDSSEGSVEFMDMITRKSTGTATAGTTATIFEDGAQDFVADGVEVDDIICHPFPGVVDKWAFVTGVSTTQLTYELIQGGTAFENGESYKVGTANKIRLEYDAPHRGLRGGTNNTFVAGAAKATINLTTFTATTCTGSATTGAEVGDEAIASGGSHGKISAVAANVLTVDYWIGGIPAAGEIVTVHECDAYDIGSKAQIAPVIWIGPTCDVSDANGDEKIMLSYYAMPALPTADPDPIPIDRMYERPFRECLKWQTWERTGLLADNPAAISALKRAYDAEARLYRADGTESPKGHTMSFWQNQRQAGSGARGVRDQVPSGIRYDPGID